MPFRVGSQAEIARSQNRVSCLESICDPLESISDSMECVSVMVLRLSA